MSFSFCLAGHHFSVQGLRFDTLLSYGSSFSPFVQTVVSIPDKTIRFDPAFSPQKELKDILYSFPLPAIAAVCTFGRYSDISYGFTIAPTAHSPKNFDKPLQMSYVQGSSEVLSTDTANPDALRFALWFAVALLLTPAQLSFVHASTIVHQGQSVLFLGESGTGKSTHARLWLQHIPDTHLLNDDSPLMGFSADSGRGGGELPSPHAFGTPWSGKTHCYIPRDYPIRAVVRLSQAPANSVRRLSTLEAFAALQPSLPPALAHDDYFSALQVNLLSTLLTRIPVYHLDCLPNRDAALLCRQTLFS